MSATVKRKPAGQASDLGPAIRIKRGEVVAEFRPDPAKPGGAPVKGARAAQGGHDYLLRRGSLDRTQHAAAVRYCDAWHGMDRSVGTLGALATPGRLPPHQQGCPTSRMVACASDIRTADAAIGQAARILVRRVVIDGQTLGTVGGAAGEGDQVTLGRLRAALDRLTEIWGIETP